MPFRPDYRQRRAERNRMQRQKHEEKQKRREEKAAERKAARGEAANPGGDPAAEWREAHGPQETAQ